MNEEKEGGVKEKKGNDDGWSSAKGKTHCQPVSNSDSDTAWVSFEHTDRQTRRQTDVQTKKTHKQTNKHPIRNQSKILSLEYQLGNSSLDPCHLRKQKGSNGYQQNLYFFDKSLVK